MTATTPENGLRARLLRLARGSVILAIALGMCAAGAPSAMAADEGDSDETPAVELHLAAGMRGTVAPGSATTASLTVQNDARDRLSAGRVTVEINRTPLTDESSVTAWLDDTEAPGDFTEIGADTTTPVDGESAVTSSLFIPAESLGELAPGIYPLRASLSGAAVDGGTDANEDDVTATTVLVVTDPAPAPIAVLVPVTATPAGGALLTADELSALTAADGDLTALLDAVTGTSAVLAIDPAIPAAIRALGSAAPEQVREWLQRLEAIPNERFALQFGDADAATQAQAALPALLQPTTLAPFLDPNNFVSTPPTTPSPTATAAPTPTTASSGSDADPDADAETDAETPSPSPTPTTPSVGPVLPDDEQLTSIDAAVPGILWPRSDISPADLAAFSGYLGEGSTSILSSTAVSGAAGARATVEGLDVLVTDAAASEALSRAASANAAPVRQRWLAEASAHLYLSGQVHGAAPLLVGLDRDETRSSEALREAIVTVDTVGFGLTALLAAPAAPAAPATLVAEPDTTRAASLQQMLEDEVVLAQFATILDDTQLLLSPKRIQIMRATAVGLSAKRFEAAVTDVRTATVDTLEAVDIPPASTIQLLSANADLPFTVRNDLPWPVTVNLAVSPSDPRLDVQAVTSATVLPGTTTRVKVPVSARVGSGEVNLRLTLFSPTGVQIGQSETVRVAVRAEWETIGLGVFGTIIVLLLGLGIIRTVRRKRREAAAESDPDSAVDSPEDAGAVAAPVAPRSGASDE